MIYVIEKDSNDRVSGWAAEDESDFCHRVCEWASKHDDGGPDRTDYDDWLAYYETKKFYVLVFSEKEAKAALRRRMSEWYAAKLRSLMS